MNMRAFFILVLLYQVNSCGRSEDRADPFNLLVGELSANLNKRPLIPVRAAQEVRG